MNASVNVSVGDGRTIQEFQKVLSERLKWLGMASENSVAACALDVLRSIRVETRIAKLSSTKIELKQESGMTPSWSTKGKDKAPCIRQGKVKYVKQPNERIVWCQMPVYGSKLNVYRWDYKRGEKTTTYYIVAGSQGEAKMKAKEKVQKRINMYKGLARHAISKLMMKTFATSITDAVNNATGQVADKNTVVVKRNLNNEYSIHIEDNLDYALDALKSGQSSIDIAMMRAANKITSVINQKCKGLVGFEKLDIPFPEVRTRK